MINASFVKELCAMLKKFTRIAPGILSGHAAIRANIHYFLLFPVCDTLGYQVSYLAGAVTHSARIHAL